MEELLKERVRFENKNIDEFDSQFEEFRKLLFSDLDLIYSTLGKAIRYGFIKSEENKLRAALLLWKASNTLLGAYQILRLGFFDESISLCRMALENAAMSYAIHQDSEIYKKYCDDRYRITKAITEAKKFDPLFGNLYGRLGKTVHTNADQALPHGKLDKETNTLELVVGGVFKPEDKFIYNDAFLNIHAVGYLDACLVESMFYKFVAQHKYWRREGDNLIVVVPEATKDTLKLLEKLQSEVPEQKS